MKNLILYFAFGHNTNIQEMKHRAHSAKYLGRAVAPNFEMIMRNHADLIEKEGSKAYGVLWSIDARDLNSLDYDEAYRVNYTHSIIFVVFKGKLYKALTYVMIPNPKETNPVDEKYIRIIQKGYRENQIPVSQLQKALRTRITKIKHEK
jgi:gamma-glutamylcyclotransferase (GGCT)/AIG2-like uncharacterized protein YtfP